MGGKPALPQTGHLRALTEAQNLGTHTEAALCRRGRSVRLNNKCRRAERRLPCLPADWFASPSRSGNRGRLRGPRARQGQHGSRSDPASRRQAASASRFLDTAWFRRGKRFDSSPMAKSGSQGAGTRLPDPRPVGGATAARVRYAVSFSSLPAPRPVFRRRLSAPGIPPGGRAGSSISPAGETPVRGRQAEDA